MPDLRRLLDDPVAVSTLTAEQRTTLAIQLAALAAALAACPPPDREHPRAPEPENSQALSGLLTIEQGAALAGVTPKSFRRRAAFRPALVRLGHRTLRVDERRLRRILANLART